MSYFCFKFFSFFRAFGKTDKRRVLRLRDKRRGVWHHSRFCPFFFWFFYRSFIFLFWTRSLGSNFLLSSLASILNFTSSFSPMLTAELKTRNNNPKRKPGEIRRDNAPTPATKPKLVHNQIFIFFFILRSARISSAVTCSDFSPLNSFSLISNHLYARP